MNNNGNLKKFDFWYKILKSFVVGLRKWSGAPFEGVAPSCNGAYINRKMIDYGYVFAFKNDSGDFFIAPASKIFYNYMFLPKKMKVADYRIVGSKPITRTVGKDCIYIPLTASGLPFLPIIESYAKRLSQLSDGLHMNEVFSRTEGIFKVKDDMGAQKVRNILDDISNGKVGVLVDDVFLDELIGTDGKGVHSLIDGVNYRGYEYETMIRETLREFFEICGISHNAANIMKKEHSVTSEVNSEEEATAVFRRFFTDETEKAVERVNEMFGLDIKTEWGKEITENVQRGTPEQEDIQQS